MSDILSNPKLKVAFSDWEASIEKNISDNEKLLKALKKDLRAYKQRLIDDIIDKEGESVIWRGYQLKFDRRVGCLDIDRGTIKLDIDLYREGRHDRCITNVEVDVSKDIIEDIREKKGRIKETKNLLSYLREEQKNVDKKLRQLEASILRTL